MDRFTLLERAADMILAYHGVVQAGSINDNDSASSKPYIIAIKTYNKTIAHGELIALWMNVSTVVAEYYKVYSLIQQGKPVAVANYYNLKLVRQILGSEQGRVEVSLTNAGMSEDFFSAENQSVDMLLQREYSDTPVPTISLKSHSPRCSWAGLISSRKVWT